MDKIVSFALVFGFIFLFYLIFIIFNKKKVDKIFDSYGALLIKAKFKLTFEKASKKKFAFIMAISDAFICATSYVIMLSVKNIYLSFVVAALALAILTIMVYFTVGYIYKKKEGKQDV